MKIRIRGNSVRYRLTKNEVEQLCKTGFVQEETQFHSAAFSYAVKAAKIELLQIDFDGTSIILSISEKLIENWDKEDQIGFSHLAENVHGGEINLLLEKDFTCLDDRGEDETNNYPNPKAQSING